MLPDSRPGLTNDGFLRVQTQKFSSIALVFFVSYLLFFLLSDRTVGIYDESFPLVNALRIMAGMVPHRDFYTPYAPGQYYLLAGLFKLTYPSLLIASLLDIAYKAAIVATFYQLLSSFCRKTVVYAGVTCALLLIVATNSNGSVLAPIALVMLCSTYLLDLLLVEGYSWNRALGGGLLAGLVFVLRYDIGLALVMLHLLFLLCKILYSRKSTGLWNLHALLPYLFGVLCFMLPLLLYFIRAGAMNDFIFGLLVYPRKNYRAGRSLPFPHPALHEPFDTIIYMAFLVVIVAVATLAVLWLRKPKGITQATLQPPVRLLITCAVFVCLAAVMSLKGAVRPGIVQSFLGLVCALVALCLLAECVLNRLGLLRVCVACLCTLVGLETAFVAMRQIRTMKRQHNLMVQYFIGHQPPEEQEWCADRNTLTRGVCYLTDPDHRQAIEYVESHSLPGDRLYIGLPAHDKVLVSDNIEYFATQRLPATRWSHFDPNLQNTAAVQKEMMAELEKTKPPLVLLDSEFSAIVEPNDSSKSSGVYLLDNYLHLHYKVTQSFGKMQVAERF